MVREDLYKLRNAVKNIEKLKEKIVRLESRRISPRSAAYGSERVQTSTKGDIQAEQEHKIDILLEKYRKELSKTLDLQIEFEDMIENMEPTKKQIARSYYCEGKIWEEIWNETGYCVRHLTRLNREILEELFPESETCP
jgi:hypothetical protein